MGNLAITHPAYNVYKFCSNAWLRFGFEQIGQIFQLKVPKIYISKALKCIFFVKFKLFSRLKSYKARAQETPRNEHKLSKYKHS